MCPVADFGCEAQRAGFRARDGQTPGTRIRLRGVLVTGLALGTSLVTSTLIPSELRGAASESEQGANLSSDSTQCIVHVTERHRFGSVDGPDALSRVANVFLNRAGRDPTIFVLLPQERELRAFSAGGEPVLHIGEGGSGPGEFEAPASAGLLDDELWVWDAAFGRLSFFGEDGTYRRSLALAAGERAFPLSDGTVVRRPRIVDPTRATDVVLERLRGEDGAVLDTLAVLRYEAATIRVGSGDFSYTTANPFSDHPLTVAASDGRGFAVVHRRLEESGQASILRVRIWGVDASTVTVHVPMDPVPFSTEDVDSVLSHLSETYLRGAMRAGVPVNRRDVAPAALRESILVPRWRPAVRGVILAPDGDIWLETVGRGNEEGVTWMVVRPGDDRICHAELPAGWSLRDVNGPVGVAVARGPMDIPQILVLEVSRRR